METPRWVKYVFATVVFVAASLAVVWLAGFLFFAFSKANPFGKTNFSTWWTYWEYYQANPVVAKRLIVSMIVAAALCYAVPLLIVIDLFREVQSLYGEARFANAAEIEQAGLLGKTGIIVGKWKNRFLMFGGAQFVLLAAPTRGGKGAACVVPNLMNWDESAVVLDVKLENYKMTSLYRQAYGQKVFLWAPFATDGRTHRHNSLGYISDDPRLRVTEILGLGYTFYPGLGKEAFFDDAARNLFLGLGLYLCETPSLPRTMGEILRQSSGKGKPVKTYLQGLINERNFREYGDVQITEIGRRADRANVLKTVMAVCNVGEEDADGLIDDLPCTLVENAPKAQIDKIEGWLKEVGKHVKYTVQRRLEPLDQWDGAGEPMLSMECVDALNRFLSTSDNTLSSIMATFNAPLTIWASPIVDAATSANDFDLRELRKQRMTVYIGIPANKLAEAKLLLNVFYSQLVALNTEQQLHATPELKYTCLMVDDEFAAPGRIGIIDTANSYMASYGLRLLTVIQSPSQIENDPPKGYGKEGASTLMTNHALQMMYTPRKQSDAEEYSRMLGTYTFKAKGTSRQVGGKNSGGHSESESDQKRPLLLPQELKVMGKRKQIISLEDTKPILCERAFFFDDHRFIDRFKSVCPTLAALDHTPIRRVLRKLGFSAKAKPSQRFFQDTWGRGELSSDVPLIDLDLHEARVQQRVRPLTVDDVAQGIDLRALAMDTSKLAFPEGDAVDPRQVEAFVDGFFNALEAADGEDESTPAIAGDRAREPFGDEMLAALDTAAGLKASRDMSPGPAGCLVDDTTNLDASIDAPPAPADDLVDDDVDLPALLEAMPRADDASHDDAGVHAAAEPKFIDVEDADKATSILDLSVLDKPAGQPNNKARH
jgi:type IV secretion system protein VirD4